MLLAPMMRPPSSSSTSTAYTPAPGSSSSTTHEVCGGKAQQRHPGHGRTSPCPRCGNGGPRGGGPASDRRHAPPGAPWWRRPACGPLSPGPVRLPLKPVAIGLALQELHVAQALAAKGEIITHHHAGRVQAAALMSLSTKSSAESAAKFSSNRTHRATSKPWPAISSSFCSRGVIRGRLTAGLSTRMGWGSKVMAMAVPPICRARSTQALKSAWCPRWTPSKLPMVTTGRL
jgi:hypothetical protein